MLTSRLLEAELCRRQKNYDKCEKILTGLLSAPSAADQYELRCRLASIAIERGAGQGQEANVVVAQGLPV